MFRPSAHFTMKIKNINIHKNLKSRFVEELNDTKELNMYIHLRAFKSKAHHPQGAISPNHGDICGYVLPKLNMINKSDFKVKSRRL